MEADLFRKQGPWVAPSDEKTLTEQGFHSLLADEAINKRLIRYLQHLTKNEHLAEDLAQDVWVTIMTKLKSGTKIYASGLPRYATKIGYRLALNAMRKSENKKPHEPLVFTDGETGEETEHGSLADPSNGAPESYLALKEAFDRLSDTEKRIFDTRYRGLKDQEIAEKLGLSVPNVRVIRHRAMMKIAHEMSEEGCTKGNLRTN